jgi:hypothetical protein
MNVPDEDRPSSAADSTGGIILEVNPDDVCQLIQLARDFHAQDAIVVPDEPSEPDMSLGVAAMQPHAGNPLLEEFRTIIQDFDRSQQVQVVALLWLGRGDYDVEEWEELLEDATDAWSDHTADYLLAHPLLADQLTEGLELLGFSCD